jgi:serine/threonine protein phosphatase PrpC
MAYRYVGVVVAKINGFQWFAWCVLGLGVSGISAQTPEIQSGSYLHKHVKQAAEYQAAQDIIAPLPELHDAFTQATAWMFERTKPRAAERNQARALAKMVAASQEFSKLEKKQIQSVLRHTAANTWKTGHTIGVSAAAFATVAALVAAWTFRKHWLGLKIGDPFAGIGSLITPPVAPAAVVPVPGVGAASGVVADAVRAATIAAELTPVVVPVPVAVPLTGVGVGAGSGSTASAGALSQSNTSAPLAGAGAGSGDPSGANAGEQGRVDEFVLTRGGAGVGAELFPSQDAYKLYQYIKANYPKSADFFLYPGLTWIGGVDPSKPLVILQTLFDSLSELGLSYDAKLILHLYETPETMAGFIPAFNCYHVVGNNFQRLNLKRNKKFERGAMVTDTGLLHLLSRSSSKEIYSVLYSDLQALHSRDNSVWATLREIKKSLKSIECYTASTPTGIGVSEIIGGRPSMEDTVAIDWSSQFKAVAVFDGHAGAAVAELCKEGLLSTLKSLGHSINDDELIKTAFYNFDYSLSGCMHNNSGSTATLVLLLENNTLKLVNLGDSRSIVVNNDGAVLMGTVDHKPTATEECSRIVRCGGCVAEGRVDGGLAVSRAFGDYGYKKIIDRPTRVAGIADKNEYKVSNIPDIIDLDLKAHPDARFVVLGCDGLWDVMSNKEVAHFVFAQKSLSSYEIARKLVVQAYTRGSSDNISVVVIDLHCAQTQIPADSSKGVGVGAGSGV